MTPSATAIERGSAQAALILQNLADQCGLEVRGSTAPEVRTRRTLRRLSAACLAAALLLITAAGLAGWRMVVIRSGSMGDEVPAGSIALARRIPGEQISVGDVIVMERRDGPSVTHEVVGIVQREGVSHAVTQGAANDFVDPEEYSLQSSTLVVSAVVPFFGRILLAAQQNLLALLLLLGAVIVLPTRRRTDSSD